MKGGWNGLSWDVGGDSALATQHSMILDAEEDEDSDAEADRLIAANRAKQAGVIAAIHAKAAASSAAAAKPKKDETNSIAMQSHWGAAARQVAVRRAKEQAESSRVLAIRKEAAAAALAARLSEASSILISTHSELLRYIHAWREQQLLNALPIEENLHVFTKCAAVCKAWRRAIGAVVERRTVLRHAAMGPLGHAPPRLEGFRRPSFISLSSAGRLLVADNHRICVLSPPCELRASSGGAPGKSDKLVRILGAPGEKPGQLYHPHGLQLTQDGEGVYVADRSNHRVQCLRLADGAVLDCTADKVLWGPYGLCLHNGLLYVADANNERIVAFNASKLSEGHKMSFGKKGTQPGSLDRPRGLARGGQVRE